MSVNRNDERYARRKYSTNPLIPHGQKALEQALAPIMDFARLQQNIINKFNDKGRPDHKVKWVDFPCVITPSGGTTGVSSSNGRRSEARFTVMYLAPYALNVGDILVHDTFGTLRITDFDGNIQQGVTAANAIKLNAGWDIDDGTSLRIEPRNIF